MDGIELDFTRGKEEHEDLSSHHTLHHLGNLNGLPDDPYQTSVSQGE